MRQSYLFTSESVSEGHPDKVADQISDAVVDLFLAKDPEARVACETLVTTNLVVLAGEIRGQGIMDTEGNWAPGVPQEIEQVVRETVRRIGYEQDGFHWQQLTFENNLHPQSAHIAQGVDATGNKDEGAGDQGIMFGFACDETPDLMPATLDYSHKILERMAADRHSGAAAFLQPDAKRRVTGLTGRKIIVDTYGGAAPHGGGAFSGKDPTKVDRSAAYAARYLAKNIVAAGLARRCTIQLAYAIGVSEPLSLYVDTHGTGTVGDDRLEAAIKRIDKLGGLTPRGIRTHLRLNKPIYGRTAAYGHFGRKADGDLFPWERTDLAEELKAALS
jgi:S-adenosylmethionine synthetase